MNVEELAKRIEIKKRRAVNRIAVLPTEGNDALENGSPSERTVNRYTEHARGGAGIIFSEAIAVDPLGKARVNQLCLQESTASSFADLIAEVKKNNPDVLFILQLDHAGSLGDPAFSRVVSVYPKKGAELLTDGEIESLKDTFIRGIYLARESGADGVDLKFSHGFLCNELIHPRNTRKGRYGGSFQNRSRFFQEVLQGLGGNFPLEEFLLGIRISVYEGIPGGFGTSGPEEVIEDYEEPVNLARMGEEAGLAFISVSAGHAAGNLEILLPNTPYPDAVFRHFGWQKKISEAVSIPVVGAGYSLLGKGRNSVPGTEEEKKKFHLLGRKEHQRGGNLDCRHRKAGNCRP